MSTARAGIPPLVPPNIALSDRWGLAFVEVRLSFGAVEKRWEIIDLDPSRGNLRYISESLWSIRRTCATVATVLPFYASAYVVWHAVRGPFIAISAFFHAVEAGLSKPSWSAFANLALLPTRQLTRSFWLALRTPFCALAMESAALYGLLRPLDGRPLCGAAERYWRGDEPCTQDFQQGYFVPSFQPYGVMSDPAIIEIQWPQR